MNKTFLALAFFYCLFSAQHAKAASYLEPQGINPGEIILDHVVLKNVDGTNSSSGAKLIALDSKPLHGGQIFKLDALTDSANEPDALYTPIDSKAIIPNLMQSLFVSHNVTLLLTNTNPLEYTVINLATVSKNSGASTLVVFNEGPKGAQGTQGPQGNQGPQGAQGAQGPAGPQGADSTIPGPIGPSGPRGLDGAPGLAGASGISTITVKTASANSLTVIVSCPAGSKALSGSCFDTASTKLAEAACFQVCHYVDYW